MSTHIAHFSSKMQGSSRNNKSPKAPTRRRNTTVRQRNRTIQDEDGATVVTREDNDEPEVKRAKKPAEIAMENFAMSLAKKVCFLYS